MAIIGVLVAISIPIFNSQLKKVRFAVNQANGRAAFSAAEAAYLDYVAGHGSITANSSVGRQATVTYTYFPEVGRGILEFHYPDGRWIRDSYGRVYTNTNVSSWTVDTEVSDGRKISYNVARVWTIHMNPENGNIVGYYCAFPVAREPQYNQVLNAFKSGTEGKYSLVK